MALPLGPKLTADLRHKKVEAKCQKGAVHIFRGAHSTVRGTIHEVIAPACVMKPCNWFHGSASLDENRITARSASAAKQATTILDVLNQIRRTEEELMEIGTMEYTLLQDHSISRETPAETSIGLTQDRTGSPSTTILFFI